MNASPSTNSACDEKTLLGELPILPHVYLSSTRSQNSGYKTAFSKGRSLSRGFRTQADRWLMLVVAVMTFIYAAYRPAEPPTSSEDTPPVEHATQAKDRTTAPMRAATQNHELDAVTLDERETAAARALISGNLDKATALYQELSNVSPLRADLAVASRILGKRAHAAEQSKARP